MTPEELQAIRGRCKAATDELIKQEVFGNIALSLADIPALLKEVARLRRKLKRLYGLES